MKKPAVLLAVLSAVGFGCATPHSSTDHATVQVNGAHSTILIRPISPWNFSSGPTSYDGRLCLIPRKLPSMPTAAINFEFMPEGTDVSRLLLQQPWIGSKPREESPVDIASTSYPLFHREGDITELWFAIVPLQGEALVASLTIAKGFENYIPEFRSDFTRMLATLEIRPPASNHAMQPTPGRRTTKFSMTSTSPPAATRALASGG